MTERLTQFAQPLPRVRDQRHCTVLIGVQRLDIERQYLAALPAEQCCRARRKVLKTGAHCQNHICVRGERIGGGGPGYSDAAEIQRMACRQRGLAGLRLAAGNTVPLAELPQRGARFGIQHAAPANDQRPTRQTQHFHSLFKLVACGRGTPRTPQPLLEEAPRPIERLSLHVLTERERYGTAGCRIRQHLHRPIEGDHQLLRSRDAIEVP